MIFLGNEDDLFSGTVEILSILQSSKKIYIIVMSFMYWKSVTESGRNSARSCVYDNFNFEIKFLTGTEEEKSK